MTYYRVDFATSNAAARDKKFRTKETAEKYAKRVLGVLDDSSLESKAAIVAVSSKRMPLE
jgi:hypothetical protein